MPSKARQGNGLGDGPAKLFRLDKYGMSSTTPPKAPKKRGRPKKEPVPTSTAKALILAAATGDDVKVSRAIAKAAQTPAPSNMNITDEMMVVILARVSSGELLRTVCKDMGVSAALVRKRGRDHPETLGRELNEARIQMAHELFDTMLEVADDLSLPVADRRLKIEVLRDMAKVHNRADYGDKVQIDQRQVVISLTPEDRGLT